MARIWIPGGASFPGIDVHTYSARGDGVTDDTAAVQAALNAAAADGREVFFPAGTFLVTGLTVPRGMTLRGASGRAYLAPTLPTQSRLKLKAGSANHLISPADAGSAATGVRISDLVLDANGQAKSALYLADAGAAIQRFWSIERCLFTNSGFSAGTHGSAIYCGNNNTGCVIRDCHVLSNDAGDPTRGGHGWDGVGWYGQDGLLENTFIGCFGNAGLLLYGGASDQTFLMIGGGCFWCLTGIVVGGAGAVLKGVSIDHNYNDGVYVGFPCSLIGCTFHSNSLQTNNTWSHVSVGAAVPANFTNCRQAPQDGDAGANIAKYFISANAGATVCELGNYQEPGATLGTGWTTRNAYSPTNVTTDRSYDANATTLDELADVLGTVIADLKAQRVLV